MARGEVAAREASEALVAAFEKLVGQAGSIADMVDEIRGAAEDFEQLVQDTLTELDDTIGQVVDDATEGTQSVQASIVQLAQNLDASALAIRSEAVSFLQATSNDISQAIDAHTQEVTDAEALAAQTIEALNSELQGLIANLRNLLGETDALWLEGLGSTQQLHQNVRTSAQQFSAQVGTAIIELGSAGESFANDLEAEVAAPVEEMLSTLDKALGDLGTRIFDEGLSELSEQVTSAVREEISELIDQAIEAIKQLIKDKIDEILDRRDRSEPERKALEAIFDALEGMIGTVEAKIGSVKEIRATVGAD